MHGGSKAGVMGCLPNLSELVNKCLSDFKQVISRVMHTDRACSARCCMSGLRSCAGDCVFG